MLSRNKSVNDLFEIILDIALPFFTICSHPALDNESTTCMMSTNRLRRSMSISSSLAALSSSAKVCE